MTEYTIYTDVHISKSKKVHVVCKGDFAEHSWHPTMMGLLEELTDNGTKEALIVGESKCFHLKFTRAIAPKVVPLLTGHEGYEKKEDPAGPEGLTK